MGELPFGNTTTTSSQEAAFTSLKDEDAPSNKGNQEEAPWASSSPAPPSMMPTYHLNRMFLMATRTTVVIFFLLLCLVYYITPVEEWNYLSDDERTVAAIASAIAGMSAILTAASFIVWKQESGEISGIVMAGITVMIISMTTNGILAFAPTIVLVDPVLQSRVFLVRWCEWIPCAGLMTFLCDAMDAPRSKKAVRKALLYSLCQSLSCVSGLVFPYCSGIGTWSLWLVFAIVTWLPIFPRLYVKYQQFQTTPKGSSYSQMERWTRHRYAFELMMLCAVIWSTLVVIWFANAYVHVSLPEGHVFRPKSLAMYVDAIFDALAKSLYMRQIVDTHRAVFQMEGIAQRQLVELRSLMSALWGSSTDLIVLSVRHELRCLTLLSPGFAELLEGSPPHDEPRVEASDDSLPSQRRQQRLGSQQALMLELVRSAETDSLFEENVTKRADLGKIHQAYFIDTNDLSFDMFHAASIVGHVDAQALEVSVAYGLVKEAWKHLYYKSSSSTLIPYDIRQRSGSECHCEMKVLPHSHNGMIAVIRDVSERYRRFAAERRAESEALRRQKEAQSQTRFVRHEVKNGLLAGIELIDNLRNELDDCQRPREGQNNTNEKEGIQGDPIKGLVGCWKRLEELDTNLHEVLDTVLAEAMARDVINEIYTPRFESVDVLALLRSSYSNVSGMFPVQSEQGDLPFLKMDRQLLRYIHRNAVSNACKYGRQGEKVLSYAIYNHETMEFQLQVINSPGMGHEKLLELSTEEINDAVFEQGVRLHDNLKINDRFVSAGDGAWIAQKCAKAMGGDCSIAFERNATIFSFKCLTLPLLNDNLKSLNFELPPDTIGVAVDDSKIQRKLLSRILAFLGVSQKNMIIVGEKASDVFDFERTVVDLLSAHPKKTKILVIMDEMLDYSGKDGGVVVLSGSKILKDLLTALPPEEERRILAMVRSANDSASDLAMYLSRAHGFLPKAPMNKERVKEVVAPIWVDRFSGAT